MRPHTHPYNTHVQACAICTHAHTHPHAHTHTTHTCDAHTTRVYVHTHTQAHTGPRIHTCTQSAQKARAFSGTLGSPSTWLCLLFQGCFPSLRTHIPQHPTSWLPTSVRLHRVPHLGNSLKTQRTPSHLPKPCRPHLHKCHLSAGPIACHFMSPAAKRLCARFLVYFSKPASLPARRPREASLLPCLPLDPQHQNRFWHPAESQRPRMNGWKDAWVYAHTSVEGT